MGTWSVAMNVVCDCILLYVNMHMTRGIVLSRQSSLWLIVDYNPSLYTILNYMLMFLCFDSFASSLVEIIFHFVPWQKCCFVVVLSLQMFLCP